MSLHTMHKVTYKLCCSSINSEWSKTLEHTHLSIRNCIKGVCDANNTCNAMHTVTILLYLYSNYETLFYSLICRL